MVFVTFQAVVTPPGISHSPWEGFNCCQSAGQASGVENCVGIRAGTGASAETDAVSKLGAQENTIMDPISRFAQPLQLRLFRAPSIGCSKSKHLKARVIFGNGEHRIN